MALIYDEKGGENLKSKLLISRDIDIDEYIRAVLEQPGFKYKVIKQLFKIKYYQGGKE